MYIVNYCEVFWLLTFPQTHTAKLWRRMFWFCLNGRYELTAGDNARNWSRTWLGSLQRTRVRYEPVLQRIWRTVPSRNWRHFGHPSIIWQAFRWLIHVDYSAYNCAIATCSSQTQINVFVKQTDILLLLYCCLMRLEITD